jgi:signal transduction histidine kinase/phage shock protein PspC (stress-responsive transcriptional regulator)
MTPMPAATTTTLRRDRSRRVLGGVAAGIARRTGLDPLLVRVAFIAAATAGFGLLVYVPLWLLLPADDGPAPAARLRTGRAALEVGLGTGLLVLSGLLTSRALGLWFSDAVVWPAVLVAAGGALLWRQSHAAPAAPVPPATPRAASTRPGAGVVPAVARAVTASRTTLGVVLVLAAALLFLQALGALPTLRDAALVIVVIALALGVIAGPFVVRQRTERIRSQERAEVAAHLHDSVLQTLALVQKRAEDPKTVAALARRQERELRAWLQGRDANDTTDLIPALEAAAADVEQAHGVAVEVVAVGDRPLDERGEALVAAAREAMVNAAKHGGGEGAVSVFVQVLDGATQVFVRDRGAGFDPAAVDADRRGISDSIVGRMRRHGGTATVHTAPGEGTEVELIL